MKHKVKVLARQFSQIATYFLRSPAQVYLDDDKSFVGYTVPPKNNKPIEIHVSHTHPIYDVDQNGTNVKDDIKEMLWYGVTGHEMLHHRYSPFTAEQETMNRLPKSEQKYFHELWNIGEDAAIEGASDLIFGGTLEKSLLATIQHFYDVSPNIDDGVPKGDICYAYQQVANALIQLGDRGPVKGKFQTPEAEEVFKKVEPVFWCMVQETNGLKRIDIAMEMFELTRPLWSVNQAMDELFQSVSQMQGGGDGQDLPSRDDENNESLSGEGQSVSNNGDQKTDTNGTQSSQQQNSNGSGRTRKPSKKSYDKKEGASESGDSKHEKKDCENDNCVSNNIKQSDNDRECQENNNGKPRWFTPGNGEGGERPEITEKDLKMFDEELQNVQNTIEIEEEEEQKRAELEKEDVPPNNDFVEHIKQDPWSDSQYYDEIVNQYHTRIQSLIRELQSVFRNDVGGKKHSEHGGKVGIRRISDGKLHSKIMLSRTNPSDISNMAVYLLVDESGSMRGSNIVCARDTAICLYEALTALGIPVAVTGFTTNSLGKARHEHFVTWHSSKQAKTSMLRMAAGNCNYDYWSIAEAGKELSKYPSKHKLLIVISDGAPCTCVRQNVTNNVIGYTKASIDRNRKNGVSVLGVAISPHDRMTYASMYGKNYLVVNQPNDMFLQIAEQIKKIAQSWAKQ